MLNLNDREWKNFMLAEMFKVDLSKGDNQPSLLQEGQYPLISAGTKNNGVCYFIKEGDGKSQLFEKNTITVDMFGTPFYHAYDFYSVSHGRVNILTAISEKFNKYVGLFIVSCITEGTKSKYTYNQMCSQKRILRQPIMLPITDDGQPDYVFMEQYIREREDKLKQKYIDFIGNNYQIGGVIPNLEEKIWKAFKVKHLFTIEKCKCSNVSTLKYGAFPYIGATNKNNGIMAFVEKKEKWVTKGNCIVFICDGQGSVGYSIYKGEDFIGSTTLKIGRNKYLNRYIAQFLVSALDKNRSMYSYGYKRNEKRLLNESIMLPITDEGSPDYEYMERYIKALMYQKYLSYITYLNNA